jgi:NitT/TauT family transport system substrate-binding protein
MCQSPISMAIAGNMTEMKDKAKSLILIIVVINLGFLIYGCRPSSSSVSQTTPLKLSVNSWVGWGPLFIAKEKGFFGSNDVDITFMEDAGARRSAMLAGQVDAYASSVDNLAIDATFGIEGKTVMCFDESAGADGIVSKKDVTWENLKGRKVAVQQGLPGHFLLLTVLAKHKMSPSDVQIKDLDADKAGSAFVSGDLDVAVTWEPWISKAAALANGKKLVTTKELPGLIVDTLVVRTSVLGDKTPQVRSLISGWFKALDYYKTHPKEGNEIIARAYKLKPQEVSDIVSGIHFYDLPINKSFMGTKDSPGPIYGVFDSASQLWHQAGVTKSTVDAKNYIDPSFLPR